MVTTLICQIQQRLPVAVAVLNGTLDSATAVNAVVTLRDCLADAPTMLLVDVRHVVVAAPAGLVGLVRLAFEAGDFPGSRVAFCGPNPELRQQLRQHRPSLIEIFDGVTAAFGAARAITVGPRLSVHLVPAPDAPRRARRMVARACSLWGLRGVGPVAELVVSELVTNAVVHAGTPSLLTVRRIGDSLQLAVRDGDPRPAGADGDEADPVPECYREHGRGLQLVDALADRWGTFATADGKVVWAQVASYPIPSPV
jgi:hypothetical protein